MEKTNFRVHLYVIVRVPIDVKSSSPEEAAKIALDEFIDNSDSMIKQGEYSDGDLSVTVDTLDCNGLYVSEKKVDI